MSPASINLLILKSLEFEALESFKTTHHGFITFLPTQIVLNLKLDKLCKFKSNYHCICNTYVGPRHFFSQAKALLFKKVLQILLMLMMG